MREEITMAEDVSASDERDERDGGYTLVELIVAMSIMTGLLAVVFTILITVTQQTADNLGRVRQTEQLRIGLMQIDRQVRSGNVISDPLAETVGDSGVEPGYSLRVYTQADGVFECAQWRVIFTDGVDQGELQYRSWDPAWASTGLVEGWQAVARGIVDQRASNPSAARPFERTASAGSSAAQSVRVSLWVKDSQALDRSNASTISSVLTGRNTVFGYPSDRCANVPSP